MAKARDKLTNTVILKRPGKAKAEGRRLVEPDPTCPGLYLITQPKTGKQVAQSWAYRYRSPAGEHKGKVRKFTLGKVNVYRELGDGEEPRAGDLEGLSLPMARVLAQQAKLLVKRKRDPFDNHQEILRESDPVDTFAGPTVEAVMIRFLKNYPLKRGREARESTKRQTGMLLGLKPNPKNFSEWIPTGGGVLAAWQGRPLSIITKRDAETLLEKMGARDAKVSANRTLAALKMFGRWCVKRELLHVNPVANVEARYGEAKRERELSDTEIAAFWKASSKLAYPYGMIAQMILLTAQRPGEVRLAPWAEFNLKEKEWTLPSTRTKNGHPHIVPLSRMVLDMLEALPRRGDYLFMAKGSSQPIQKQSRMKRELDVLMLAELEKGARQRSVVALAPFTLHDLRRTATVGMARLKNPSIPPHVIDKVLNHQSGAISGIAAVYNTYDYLEERAEALERWANRVHQIVGRKVQLLPAPAKQLAPPEAA